MENLKALSELSRKIKGDLEKITTLCKKNEEGYRLAIEYQGYRISFDDDAGLIKFLEAKKVEFEEKLKPITARLEILDELAKEVLK